MMKRYISILFSGLALTSILLLAGCRKEKTGPDDDGEDEVFLSETVGSEKITAFSAVLKGKATLGASAGSGISMGIVWSDDPDLPGAASTRVKADNADKDSAYSVAVKGLTPGKKYYFRSFLSREGKDLVGETMEFTTKDVSSVFQTLAATGVTATTADLNAKLDLTDVPYSNLEYGFWWGVSETVQDKLLKGGSLSGGKYAAGLKDLSPKTQYWYKAYLKLDGQSFEGSKETFTTDVIPVESVSLDKQELTFHQIGDFQTLKATVYPSNALEKGIKWTSSDEAVAKVDDDGRVTAVANGVAVITVTTDDQGKTASCTVTVAQYVTSISLDKALLTLQAGESATLTATVAPGNAADKSLTWTSSDEAVAKVDDSGKVQAIARGTATVSATAADGSKVKADCSVTVYSYDTPDAVDLGLNVKWASCNVGASKPEEPGLRFAWGETEPKDNYAWPTYQWCYGTYNTITKYNTRPASGIVDNETVLKSEDDVASAKLGAGFRMPTQEEFRELIENCDWTWAELGGMAGYKVTGKKEGYTDKWIFLPAVGHIEGQGAQKEGILGYYWSSSVNTDSPRYAYYLGFGSGDYYWYKANRCDGLSVRAVVD